MLVDLGRRLAADGSKVAVHDGKVERIAYRCAGSFTGPACHGGGPKVGSTADDSNRDVFACRNLPRNCSELYVIWGLGRVTLHFGQPVAPEQMMSRRLIAIGRHASCHVATASSAPVIWTGPAPPRTGRRACLPSHASAVTGQVAPALSPRVSSTRLRCKSRFATICRHNNLRHLYDDQRSLYSGRSISLSPACLQ